MAYNESTHDPFDLFGDGDAFLENVDFSSLFLQTDQGFEFNQDASAADTVDRDGSGESALRIPAATSLVPNDSQIDQTSISRFGSPLPSLRAELRPVARQTTNTLSYGGRQPPSWKVSHANYTWIESTLAPLLPSLPKDFELPSRHTMSRYLEGCIRGPYEHTP